MKLNINANSYEFAGKMTLEAIANEVGHKGAVCAAVNGRIRELTYILNEDADVEFMGLDTHDGMRIYEASLRYVFAMAVYRLNPSLKIRFSYSVSRSILATIDNAELTDELYEKIVAEVKKIVQESLTIKRLSVSKDEATKIYTNFGYHDKIETLKLRKENNVNLYQAGS